ncbi:MAG: Cof-type HAD-IIB family hydrolase [Oscillospiraceae bacterium]|nr:Cof-type HAD-IIB family hydrolase [Oscillospiraceae bacterium]
MKSAEEIKAVFFDIDGTLFSHRSMSVPESTRLAIEELRRKNIRIVAATGRYPAELSGLPTDDIAFDAYITLNGQMCFDAAGKVFFEHAIDDVQGIVQLFNAKKYPIVLVEKERTYLNYDTEGIRRIPDSVQLQTLKVDKYMGGAVFQAVAYINEEEEADMRSCVSGVEITRWHDYGLDLVAEGGSKVTGIRKYLEKEQIHPSETMAFGDGENDIEMLRFAGIGVAMGNAGKTVRDAADYITDDIDEDGVWRALLRYGVLDQQDPGNGK